MNKHEMGGELPLFAFSAYARNSDPKTSHVAAKSVRGDRVSELQGLVLSALSALGNGTSEEVARHLNVDLQSITPRFAPMNRAGMIELTGDTRPGISGRSRQVWRVKEAR